MFYSDLSFNGINLFKLLYENRSTCTRKFRYKKQSDAFEKESDTIEDKIRRCFSLCEKYQNSLGNVDKVNLSEAFQDDMIKMAYLIAISDGSFDRAELMTIVNTFSIILSENKLNEKYYEDCSLQDNFFNRVPDIIKLICRCEREELSFNEYLMDARFIHKTLCEFGIFMVMSDGCRMKIEIMLLDSLKNVSMDYIISEEKKLRDSHMAGGMVQTSNANTRKTEEFNVSKADGIKEMDDILKEIDSLIGLDNVKTEIHNLVNLLLIRKMREERGLKQPSIAMHLVFTGNPGTGKTTIARKLSKIYQCLGILDKGTLVETDRAGMVAGYMGQTAQKVQDLAQSALGGILFIDEAYTLTNNDDNDAFGQEAVDTLLKIMEDKRDELIVIVAGYAEPMEKFLDSNPGLRSRFNRYISFENYTLSDLNRIFIELCEKSDYKLTEDAKEELLVKLREMILDGGENFANAREVRNYFDKVCSNQANRIVAMMTGNDEDLMTITKEDM